MRFVRVRERARADALREGLATAQPQGLVLTETGLRLAASLTRRPGQLAAASA